MTTIETNNNTSEVVRIGFSIMSWTLFWILFFIRSIVDIVWAAGKMWIGCYETILFQGNQILQGIALQ